MHETHATDAEQQVHFIEEPHHFSELEQHWEHENGKHSEASNECPS
jgi:hypothetical protein